MTPFEKTSSPTYAQFIHLSRYSRWLPEEGRRETWAETVERYINFFRERNLELPSAVGESIWQELYDGIYNLDVMPSMRCLMTAGPALERDNVAGYNPVAGDTPVLTYEYGLVPIKDLAGRTCKVLNVEGRWTDATFRSYGEQKTVVAQFRLNSNTQHAVECTLNHRWILADGTVVPTEGLKPGNRIKFVAGPKPEPDSLDYRLGVQHGFIYGDGTSTYAQERLKGYHIRICSDQEDTLSWFSEYPVTYPPSAGGDPVVMMYGAFAKTHALKELPSAEETDQYLLGFMRGWLAADGSVSNNSQVQLAAGLEEIQWLHGVASRLGYVVQSKYEFPDDTNYGKRNKKLWSVSFSRSSMCADDFLIARKRANFKPLESHHVFTGFAEEVGYKEVFCAEVPDTNTFVLAKGLVTGNCSYLPIDHPRSFDELMYVLMCGTGVGFSVERQYISKLPEIADTFHDTDTVLVVADSKIGWASSLRQLISLLFNGMVPKWDLSRIRPAGARLKTFGGRASGPEPLEKLFKFTVQLFKKAAGRKLTSLECHDLVCMIADIVVVGGVRRSALISLSNLSDDRMRLAKSGQWWVENPQRALANNSASYTEKPEFEVFLKEWKSLYESKSGERGIFSRVASKKQAAKSGRRDSNVEFGTNPCCVPGDVPVLTDRGYYPIGELLGQHVNVWNGVEWSNVLIQDTGVQELVRVSLSDGTSLVCTPNHKFVLHDGYVSRLEGSKRVKEAKTRKELAEDLDGGETLAKFSMPTVELPVAEYESRVDPYSQGFYSGDGNDGHEWSLVYPPKYSAIPRLHGQVQEEAGGHRRWVHGEMLSKTFVPTNSSISFSLNWLAGLLDADGTLVRDNGYALQLSSVDSSFLLNVRLMLTRLGVQAKLNKMNEAGLKQLPNGRGGYASYECQTSWRLCINQADTAHLQSLGLRLSRLDLPVFEAQRDARRFVTVESVERLGRVEQTYCFTEPKLNQGTFNGIVTGQSEIILRPYQFCNLSEVVVRSTDTWEDLSRKVRLATLLGTLQSTLVDFRYLRPIWKKNTEEERLLGVSLTGIMDHPVLGDPTNPKLPELLNALRGMAIETNKALAEQLGIPASTAITCVKPSGCRPGDALTSTSKGLLTLDEIMETHRSAETWHAAEEGLTALQGETCSRITKTYRNGESPVIELTLSYGMTVESTPNHRWFVKQRYDRSKLHKYVDVNDWISAANIQPGDILDVCLGAYSNESEALLTTVSCPVTQIHASVQVELMQPTTMSPDLAWLIGYLYGDGCLSASKHRVRFIDQNLSHLEKAQRILFDVFGLETSIHRASQDRDAWILEKGSVWLYSWFVANGFDKATMTIPRKIRESSKESIIAFMAGLLDSDGCVSTKNGVSKFVFTTAYDEFAKQLQDVSWAVGLGIGRSLNSRGQNLQQTKNMWLMTSAAIQSADSVRLLAKHSMKAATVETWHHEVATKSSILGKVVSSRVSRVVPTYDVEVDNTHWYYAGAVKSHNTVSQLVDAASGIHPRFSEYYIRRVRADKKDPLAQMMKLYGFPCEDDVMNPGVYVFSFPMKAPDGAQVTKEVGAMHQLKLWKAYQDHWCEHKPSITVYYKDSEFLEVGAWVYNHFDSVSGISFLPYSDHVYKQAPYEEISKEQYEALALTMPKDVDWAALKDFEVEDSTTGSQTLACAGGVCEVVDLVSSSS